MSGVWLVVTIFVAVSGGATIGLFVGCCCTAASRGDELNLTFLSRSER